MTVSFAPDFARSPRSGGASAAGFTSCCGAQGIMLNHKKLRRLYAEERLQVRRRGGRKRALGTRGNRWRCHEVRTSDGRSTLCTIS